MDAKFINSKNSKTSDSQKLFLNLFDEIKLKRRDKYIFLSNLNIWYVWEIAKCQTKTINLKCQLQRGIKHLIIPDRSYCVSDIQDYLEYIFEKHWEKTDYPSIRIYKNTCK